MEALNPALCRKNTAPSADLCKAPRHHYPRAKIQNLVCRKQSVCTDHILRASGETEISVGWVGCPYRYIFLRGT